MSSTERTEKQVLEELSAEERALLKRVLEIERAKLHITRLRRDRRPARRGEGDPPVKLQSITLTNFRQFKGEQSIRPDARTCSSRSPCSSAPMAPARPRYSTPSRGRSTAPCPRTSSSRSEWSPTASGERCPSASSVEVARRGRLRPRGPGLPLPAQRHGAQGVRPASGHIAQTFSSGRPSRRLIGGQSTHPRRRSAASCRVGREPVLLLQR